MEERESNSINFSGNVKIFVRFLHLFPLLTMSLCQGQNYDISVPRLIVANATPPSYSSLLATVHRMTQDMEKERASKLAMDAINLANVGQVEVQIPFWLRWYPDPADRLLERIAQTSRGSHSRS